MGLVLLAQAAEHRDLAASPNVFGLVAFIILLVLLTAVLMFGKGRPHS